MNGYLLDTHVLLWWLDTPERLSQVAQRAISDPSSHLYTSAIAGWEIGIKVGLGKLKVPDTLLQAMEDAGIEILQPTFEQGLALQALPPHHRDPFDRLLIAQAIAEDLVLITHDKQIERYEVQTLRA